MRIISGKYKGQKIEGYNIDGTRPTMDRIKESMFAMIQSNIKDSIALDLFSGSGNLGLEAISNGSKKVYFVDKNIIAVKAIKDNVKKMNMIEEIEIVKDDYLNALNKFYKENIKFDLIFLDPPYKENFINDILSKLNDLNLVNNNGLIVCEYDKEEVKNDTFNCIKEKRYGDKYIKIYRKD